jgi:transcriptional regulator with XRE-family HTH domain
LDVENAFGQVLRHLRKEKRLSQEELAHRSNLDRTYISLLERGLRQPSLSSIFQLSNSLGISPSEIVSEVEIKLNEDIAGAATHK